MLNLLRKWLFRFGLVLQLKANFVEVPQQRALWSGTDYDIEEANRDGIVAATALAGASANGNGADQDNPAHSGVEVVVDITAISGAGATLTLIIEGKDPLSGKYYPLLTSAGLVATGTTALQIYPGVAVTANVTASRALPRTWRVRYTIVGTTPAVTATIAAAKLR